MGEPEFGTGDEDPVPGFELPAVDIPKTDPEKEQNISKTLFIYVDSYQFEGNTVISDKELTATARPYTKRKVSNAELQELRNLLTRAIH